jgi:HEAT repeat protein
MDDRARLLVDILADHGARPDERDDAASYLGRYADESVVRALATVASSTEEDEVLVATAGESIAEIWIALGRIQPDVLHALAPPAKAEVESLLAARAPQLLS